MNTSLVPTTPDTTAAGQPAGLGRDRGGPVRST